MNAFKIILPIICIFFLISCDQKENEIKDHSFKKKSIYSNPQDSVLLVWYNIRSYDLRDINPDSSKFYAEKAIALSEKYQDLNGFGDAYIRLGIYERKRNNYSKSISYFRQSLFYRKQIDSADLIARVYTNIGNVYKDSAVFDSSIYYQHLAIMIADSIHDFKRKALYLENLGTTHDQFDNFIEAKHNYFESLKIRIQQKDTVGISKSYINLGSIYYKLNKYDSAIYYLRNALHLEEILPLDDIASIYNNFALNYQSLNQIDSAEMYFKESIEIYREIESIKELCLTLNNLGILCQQNKKPSECILYLKESLSLAKQENIIDQLAINNKLIGDYFNDLNMSDSAIKYYADAISSQDSLFSHAELQLRSYADIQSKFVSDKARQEFLLKEQKREQEFLLKEQRQKLFQRIIILISIALLIISFLLFNRRQLRKKLEYEQKLAQDRTRISSDLHDDIGAALSSISMYSDVVKMKVENKNMDEANDLLTEIASTSRELMDHMSDLVWAINPRNDSFEKIIQRTKSFAHRVFESKNIQLHFTHSENLPALNLPMEVRHNLFMIYKESINNIAKYSRAKQVFVDVNYNGKKIVSKIKDDGVGFDLNKNNEGNGLKNMKRRAIEIGAQYSIQTSVGNGTQSEIIYQVE